jgi:hypothetical protein
MKDGECDETVNVPLSDAVVQACHDINSALAAVISCLEYIADTTRGQSHDAADDGRKAARRVAALTQALSDRCRAIRPA